MKVRDVYDFVFLPDGRVDVNSTKNVAVIERQKVIEYLQSGVKYLAIASLHRCKICDTLVDTHTFYTDGKWAWPKFLRHYIDVHNIGLPKEFLLSMREGRYEFDRKRIEAAVVEEDIEF